MPTRVAAAFRDARCAWCGETTPCVEQGLCLDPTKICATSVERVDGGADERRERREARAVRSRARS